jgi:ATP-dependent Clp protease ATP-binding subunit ClpC
MEAKFSNRVKEVISLSREEAIRLGHDYIGTEHLLLGMIREGEGTAITLLKKTGHFDRRVEICFRAGHP